ncbi:Protoglobin-domain-containing protein [Geopyxis carbonaria]|nr:Protoglobin-domain-containing protein [Geopyxis carbonaria]
MQHISPASLSSLPERVAYLRAFLNFTDDDAAALHAAAPLVGPLVPAVVDAVYTKLLSFDITAASFVPRQTGYTGAAPAALSDLSLSHPQIKFRQDFLRGYLVKLVSMDYSLPSSWEYLDKVGLMHTGDTGRAAFRHRAKRPALRVELVHCAVLLGYVEDILVEAVMGMDEVPDETKTAVLRALNKVVWIQNDLFARHYVKETEDEAAAAEARAGLGWAAVAAVAVGCVAVGAGVGRWLSA